MRKRFLIAALVVLFLFGGAGAGFLRGLQKNLPPLSKLERIEPPIKTLFFAAGGDTLAEVYEFNRVLVPLDRIPDALKRGVIAVEDRKFYTHWGVNVRAILRALARNVEAGQVVQGASTITQQLARNLFSHEEKGWMAQTYNRKLREALLALEIEKRYTKDEILEMYLNQIFLGNRAYGVEAAAQVYFGKRAEELDLAESALLVGVIKNPRDYSPVKYPEAAKRRRDLVLDILAEQGIAGRAEVEEAAREPIVLAAETARRYEAGYFVEYCRRIVEEIFPDEEYLLRGLRVYTTLDARAQRIAEEAVESHLARIEENRGYTETHASYLRHREAGKAPNYIQGALLAIEPETGRILAMVGGRSYQESNWNRAVQAPRQPGSAFKPFLYAAALMEGHRASDMILDSPVVLPQADGTQWRPKNYHREFYGLVSLRTALAKSINLPAVKLALMLGPEKAVEMAHTMGIRSPLEPVPSIALGAEEVNLLELTTAYSVFRNGGILVEPVAITRIEDRNGEVLYKSVRDSREAIAAPLAALMTSMLESVVDNGTAYA
ncbi:MAG: PBP1A family penicillin-binding protein, partial [Candidatus Latescibacterota bacterium]